MPSLRNVLPRSIPRDAPNEKSIMLRLRFLFIFRLGNMCIYDKLETNKSQGAKQCLDKRVYQLLTSGLTTNQPNCWEGSKTKGVFEQVNQQLTGHEVRFESTNSTRYNTATAIKQYNIDLIIVQIIYYY
jgi:hypothetical protein